jgi:hypothetical protein
MHIPYATNSEPPCYHRLMALLAIDQRNPVFFMHTSSWSVMFGESGGELRLDDYLLSRDLRTLDHDHR